MNNKDIINEKKIGAFRIPQNRENRVKIGTIKTVCLRTIGKVACIRKFIIQNPFRIEKK